MDNIGIVVESLDAAVSFFTELGLELEGRSAIQAGWAERVTGLHPMHVEVAKHGAQVVSEVVRFETPIASATSVGLKES
jgi:catechol 2,3-dioxygenase-like lactoylglutathione lyase family enzyme